MRSDSSGVVESASRIFASETGSVAGPWSAADPFVLYARACILTADGHVPEATDLVERAAARRPALGWIARVDPLLRPLGLG